MASQPDRGRASYPGCCATLPILEWPASQSVVGGSCRSRQLDWIVTSFNVNHIFKTYFPSPWIRYQSLNLLRYVTGIGGHCHWLELVKPWTPGLVVVLVLLVSVAQKPFSFLHQKPLSNVVQRSRSLGDPPTGLRSLLRQETNLSWGSKKIVTFSLPKRRFSIVEEVEKALIEKTIKSAPVHLCQQEISQPPFNGPSWLVDFLAGQ